MNEYSFKYHIGIPLLIFDSNQTKFSLSISALDDGINDDQATVLTLKQVACAGLPAARNCEPRQARKGAAAAMDAGAGIRTV